MTNRIDSPEFQREFNKACFDFLGIAGYDSQHGIEILYDVKDPSMWYSDKFNAFDDAKIFDPCNDANDLEKVEEKLKASVYYIYPNEAWCCQVYENSRDARGATDKSRRVAIIKCIAKVLGVDCE